MHLAEFWWSNRSWAEKGGHGVFRRLARLLRVTREIKKIEPTRCIIDTANDPHEISLDENVTRENVHPADDHLKGFADPIISV